MSKVLVLYYSSYGHTATMAESIAEGARGAGAEVDVRRVKETAPKEVAEKAGFVADERHPEIEGPDALRGYDAIICGSPTRYGRVSSQMAAFWDTTGGLWQEGALVNKLGAVFTSTATQHGGQETTLFSLITNLMHMGMVIVPMDYGYEGLQTLDEVSGGTPYGPTTIAAPDGSRQPSENELGAARYLGQKVAKLASKMAG